MRRIIISVIILEILQFAYFSYQIDQIKGVVSDNATTANERAKASVVVALQFQDQLNSLKKSMVTISSRLK